MLLFSTLRLLLLPFDCLLLTIALFSTVKIRFRTNRRSPLRRSSFSVCFLLHNFLAYFWCGQPVRPTGIFSACRQQPSIHIKYIYAHTFSKCAIMPGAVIFLCACIFRAKNYFCLLSFQNRRVRIGSVFSDFIVCPVCEPGPGQGPA